MSFVHRKIDVVLQIGTGADGQNVGEAHILTGHRVSATCTIAGGPGMAEASVRIFGMTEDKMSKFSTLGALPMAYKNNLIQLQASDESGNMAVIFTGTILAAYEDMMAAPEVAFNITAQGGLIQALMPALASTFPGSVDAADVLAQLAAQGGLHFQNNGVSVQLHQRYYHGAIRTQIMECAEDAGVSVSIENNTLTIWPRRGFRAGPVPLISPETGMVGYPTYTSTGLGVTTVFNPNVACGALVEVDSSFKRARGTWKVVTLVHDIEAETPGGKWFTQMQLAPPSLVVIPSK